MSPTGFTGRVMGIGFTTDLVAASLELIRVELAAMAITTRTAIFLISEN
jgi:hypothetical protein